MAVGAYMAYNCFVRIDGMPLLVALLAGGFCHARGHGVRRAQPARQGPVPGRGDARGAVFLRLGFLRIPWFTGNSPSGSVSVANLQIFGWPIATPLQKYLFCLALLALFALLAKTWCAARSGASGWPSATWMWPLR